MANRQLILFYRYFTLFAPSQYMATMRNAISSNLQVDISTILVGFSCRFVRRFLVVVFFSFLSLLFVSVWNASTGILDDGGIATNEWLKMIGMSEHSLLIWGNSSNSIGKYYRSISITGINFRQRMRHTRSAEWLIESRSPLSDSAISVIKSNGSLAPIIHHLLTKFLIFDDVHVALQSIDWWQSQMENLLNNIPNNRKCLRIKCLSFNLVFDQTDEKKTTMQKSFSRFLSEFLVCFIFSLLLLFLLVMLLLL